MASASPLAKASVNLTLAAWISSCNPACNPSKHNLWNFYWYLIAMFPYFWRGLICQRELGSISGSQAGKYGYLTLREHMQGTYKPTDLLLYLAQKFTSALISTTFLIIFCYFFVLVRDVKHGLINTLFASMNCKDCGPRGMRLSMGHFHLDNP